MSNADIVWVGISLNADDNPRVPRSRVVKAHDAIVRIICEPNMRGKGTETSFLNGASVTEYILQSEPVDVIAIDIYNTRDRRIGFGIKLLNDGNGLGPVTERGKQLIPKVADWLRSSGITLPVSVWAWSPSNSASSSLRKA